MEGAQRALVEYKFVVTASRDHLRDLVECFFEEFDRHIVALEYAHHYTRCVVGIYDCKSALKFFFKAFYGESVVRSSFHGRKCVLKQQCEIKLVQ